jgi:3-phosphoshikimate 1-carboxyvinyltransferase
MIELNAPHTIKGAVKLPGSKSISNRLLILKEIAGTEPVLHNLSNSEDTGLLQKALGQYRKAKTVGDFKNLSPHSVSIDVNHAGTNMRFLTALLSVSKGSWHITGSARMKERPISELVNALRSLGAEISYTGQEGFPPLSITGKQIPGGKVKIDSSVSSQFVSALLLIAPKLKNGLELHLTGDTVSKPYIEMTISLLKTAGAKVEREKNIIKVQPSTLENFQNFIQIESDWSAASYWYSVCALSENAEIELSQLTKTSLQADSVLPALFEGLGVKTVFNQNTIQLSRIPRMQTEFEYDFTDCPDIAQTIAVTCFGLGIPGKLTGLKTLKIKETNRLLALKQELEKFGSQVEITGHSIHVIPAKLKEDGGHVIKTYNDHRIAMSFAPLSLKYDRLKIDDPNVVGKSYPAFWDDLKSLRFSVNLQPN